MRVFWALDVPATTWTLGSTVDLSTRSRVCLVLSSNSGAPDVAPLVICGKWGPVGAPDRPVLHELYQIVLEAYNDVRLNRARAMEPARKLLDNMATCGHTVPAELTNTCVMNVLDAGPGGTYGRCDGVDATLSMVAVAEAWSGGSLC